MNKCKFAMKKFINFSVFAWIDILSLTILKIDHHSPEKVWLILRNQVSLEPNFAKECNCNVRAKCNQSPIDQPIGCMNRSSAAGRKQH